MLNYAWEEVLRDLIDKWKEETHIDSPVGYQITYEDNRGRVLTLYTNRPGIMIGYKGTTIAKYRDFLENSCNIKKVNFIEIDGAC